MLNENYLKNALTLFNVQLTEEGERETEKVLIKVEKS